MAEISSESHFFSGNIANMIPESPLNKMVLSRDLTWSEIIQAVASKANRMLDFAIRPWAISH